MNMENIAKSEDSSHAEVRRKSYPVLREMHECVHSELNFSIMKLSKLTVHLCVLVTAVHKYNVL